MSEGRERGEGSRWGTVAWAAARDQEPAATALRTALREDRVPQALLLVGQPGIGQRELTTALAGALECERTGLAAAEREGVAGVLADEGCDECATCGRIGRGTWTGLVEFRPEGATHLVRQVRDDWIPVATRSSSEGRRRVLRIVRADRMNETTQNAFLKILEEPPDAVVWVLEVEDPSRLLDTVRSRVRRLDLRPWSPATLADWLRSTSHEVPDDHLPGLLRAATGSPDRLVALLSGPRRETRELALDTLRRLVEEGPAQVDTIAREVVAQGTAYAKEREQEHQTLADRLHEDYGVERDADLPRGLLSGLRDRWKREQRAARGEPLQAYLDDLGSWLRDLLAVVGAGGDPQPVVEGLVNRDRLPELARDAGWFEVPDLLESLAAVERCRDALERNGVGELHLDRLLLTLAGPAYVASR